MDIDGSRLILAVENRDYAEVIRLLDNGVDVNYIDPLGNSPLQTAIRHRSRRDLEIAELLLKRNANVNANFNVNRYGQTIPSPLYLAAWRGHLSVIKLLIKYGASLETKCSNGLLPIHVAAQEGHFKIVKYFVENKLYHVDICTRTLRTPLGLAFIRGHREIVEYLIKCNADITKADMSNSGALHYACEENREDIIEALIKKGCKLDGVYNRLTPLHICVREGYLSAARRLIQSGAMSYLELDTEGQTLMHEMVREIYNKKMLECFFKEGISGDFQTVEGYSLLHAAAEYDQPQMISFLLQNGASIDGIIIFKGTTALHLASKHMNCDATQVLLNKGADVMAVDRRGRRPLDYVYKDNDEFDVFAGKRITEFLVKHMVLFYRDIEVTTPSNFPSGITIDEFKQECQEQIEQMKTCLIENTTVSLYTLLQALRNKNKLLNFLRNLEFQEELENIKKYIDKYPIYSSLLPMILDGVHNAKERLLLLEKASAAMDIIVPNLILECKINILQMLNNEDLSSLIESVTV